MVDSCSCAFCLEASDVITPMSHRANSSAIMVRIGRLITVDLLPTDAPRAYMIELFVNIFTLELSTVEDRILVKDADSFMILAMRVAMTSFDMALVGKIMAEEKPGNM